MADKPRESWFSAVHNTEGHQGEAAESAAKETVASSPPVASSSQPDDASADAPVVDTSWYIADEAGSAAGAKKKDKPKHSGLSKPFKVGAVVAAAGTAALVAAAIYLVPGGGDETSSATAAAEPSAILSSEEVSPAATAAAEPSAVPSSEEVSPAALQAPSRCPDQPPADPATAAGAVVAFQKAYFEGDIEKINSLITPDSYLHRVDWGTVLDGLIGSKWCVKVVDATDSSVTADVTAVKPSGEEMFFMQIYTVENLDGGFKIARVEDR